MKVRFIKLNEYAVAPAYGSAEAAGADLYYPGEELEIAPGETVFLKTGIAVEIPRGYMGLVFARSGLSCKRDLAPANKVGVIDSDYRGEVTVALHNHGKKAQIISRGERIAQMVITPYLRVDYELAECLDSTERGDGGFGSTGK